MLSDQATIDFIDCVSVEPFPIAGISRRRFSIENDRQKEAKISAGFNIRPLLHKLFGSMHTAEIRQGGRLEGIRDAKKHVFLRDCHSHIT
jgi:hypothetical protein